MKSATNQHTTKPPFHLFPATLPSKNISKLHKFLIDPKVNTPLKYPGLVTHRNAERKLYTRGEADSLQGSFVFKNRTRSPPNLLSPTSLASKALSKEINNGSVTSLRNRISVVKKPAKIETVPVNQKPSIVVAKSSGDDNSIPSSALQKTENMNQLSPGEPPQRTSAEESLEITSPLPSRNSGRQQAANVKKGAAVNNNNNPGSLKKEIMATLETENPRTIGKVLRRKSCHCSECGGLSKFERGQQNIVIPTKRDEVNAEKWLEEKMQEKMKLFCIDKLSWAVKVPRKYNRIDETSNDYSPISPEAKKFVNILRNLKGNPLLKQGLEPTFDVQEGQKRFPNKNPSETSLPLARSPVKKNTHAMVKSMSELKLNAKVVKSPISLVFGEARDSRVKTESNDGGGGTLKELDDERNEGQSLPKKKNGVEKSHKPEKSVEKLNQKKNPVVLRIEKSSHLHSSSVKPLLPYKRGEVIPTSATLKGSENRGFELPMLKSERKERTPDNVRMKMKEEMIKEIYGIPFPNAPNQLAGYYTTRSERVSYSEVQSKAALSHVNDLKKEKPNKKIKTMSLEFKRPNPTDKFLDSTYGKSGQQKNRSKFEKEKKDTSNAVEKGGDEETLKAASILTFLKSNYSSKPYETKSQRERK